MEFLKLNAHASVTERTANSFQKRIMSLFLVILWVLISGASETRGAVAKDYDLKAVFLYNFAQFVDWPAEAFRDTNSLFVIGILGSDPFGKGLDEVVRKEMVRNRKLVVERYRRVEEIGACQILFISQSEAGQLEQILSSLKGRSILTVGESDGFASCGGMIRFLTDQKKIRLRINNDAAKAANLTLSSKLLKAAHELVDTTPR